MNTEHHTAQTAGVPVSREVHNDRLVIAAAQTDDHIQTNKDGSDRWS